MVVFRICILEEGAGIRSIYSIAEERGQSDENSKDSYIIFQKFNIERQTEKEHLRKELQRF